jgi:hypothetical protein
VKIMTQKNIPMIPRLATLSEMGRLIPALLVCLLWVETIGTPAAAARELVQAPAGGGPGISVYEPDCQPLLRPTRIPAPTAGSRIDGVGADKSGGTIEIGGDDVIVANGRGLSYESMDIASNGDIYVAVASNGGFVGGDYSYIQIHRSTDGGTTFQQWAALGDATSSIRQWEPSLVIAEGTVDRCYVAFTQSASVGSDIIVAWEDLDATTADFADQVAALSSPGERFDRAELIADDSSYSSFYLYLVADSGPDSRKDIWFTRSQNQGASWDAGYEIATTGTANTVYVYPSISYGFGRHIHVTWGFRSATGAFDGAVRYRRAANDADGGLADWGPLHALSPTNDGLFDYRPRVAAAHDGNDVVLISNRLDYDDGTTLDPVLLVADDAGAQGFATSPDIGGMLGSIQVEDLLRDPNTGSWYASLGDRGQVIWTAPAASPGSWSERGYFDFEDFTVPNSIVSGAIAVDPTHNDRIAICRGFGLAIVEDYLAFDAEWRSDPGYPIQAPGFPVALSHRPFSDPALVDLNGDGSLEIVFGDAGGNIQAIQADGSDLPGWPVDVGFLSSSPIAVGRLTLSDEVTVVAGTNNGRVFALRPDGSILPGFPFDMETSAPMHVSIGALGGPFPGTIVLASGDRILFLDHTGRWAQDSLSRQYVGHEAVQPCAIGDIDGDGVAEVVAAWDTGISVYKRDVSASLFEIGLPAEISGPVTLGDADLDGDLEIAVPLANGTMHLFDKTGAEMPGWPFVSTGDAPMNGAAWANVVNGNEPELVLATSAWKLHLVDGAGVQQAGFPVTASLGWFQYSSPIIGQIGGIFPDIAIGTRGSEGWAFNAAGGRVDGWPRDLGVECERTPALGDIDQDGTNELVLLTAYNVQVFDLRTAPLPPQLSWPMAGHDAQRTGCSDCLEDRVSAVDEPATAALTRVSFAPPYPNPATSHAEFSFAVPANAVVSLEILDVRGRRIRTVGRSEMVAGRHALSWDGRDQRQRRVATGVYYARLRVSGPGVDEVVTRKLTMVR